MEPDFDKFAVFYRHLAVKSVLIQRNYAFTHFGSMAILAALFLGRFRGQQMKALKNIYLASLTVCCMFLMPSLSQAEGFDAAAKYAQTCAVCHNSGAAGAPKKGDASVWADRLVQGEESLLAAVKNGKGAMPAKGLCTDCSDEQFKALIQYMVK